MKLDKLSITELEDLQLQINKKIGNLSEGNKDIYYLHLLECVIVNWVIENITFSENYDTDTINNNDYIDDDYGKPYVDYDIDKETGSIEVSLYSKTKTATDNEIFLLEEEMMKQLITLKKNHDDYVIKLEKHNIVMSNKHLKTYIRLEKLKNIIDDTNTK